MYIIIFCKLHIMIATILPSSNNFHAVAYNEQKVAEGKAELVEMLNFGYISNMGEYSTADLITFLRDYSAQNNRIQKPQFHIAFSCRGHEMTHEQLVNFAHRYMHEMGYGLPGQPLLIYAHHDTANNHIHVITSRVAPDGHKIDNSHERRRSQDVINRLLGQNENLRVGESATQALDYRFNTVQQFMAILETMGYDCYRQDESIILKRAGLVQDSVPLSLVESLCQQLSDSDQRRKAQLRAILKKYRDMYADKQELQQLMRDKFGVSLVFLGSKDSPYGYMIVDHHTKTVFKGSEILRLRDLLQFQSREERFRRMESFIDQMLEDNRNLTTRELNKLLRRQFGCKLMNGAVLFNGTSHELPEHVLTTLRSNDRLNWLQSFHPSTAEEALILCKMGKYNHPDRLTLDSENPNKATTVHQLKDLFDNTPDESLSDKLHEDGYYIVNDADRYYCIDFTNKVILDMESAGLDVSRLKKHQTQQEITPVQPVQPVQKPNIIQGIRKVLQQSGGSKDANREHEVGSHGNYDDIDDERHLKR